MAKRDTPEVALRQAALEWALAAQAPVKSHDDREMKRVDRKLQRAALKFAATHHQCQDGKVVAWPAADCGVCGDGSEDPDENAIYMAIIGELEQREHDRKLIGNAHHLAQKLAKQVASALEPVVVRKPLGPGWHRHPTGFGT